MPIKGSAAELALEDLIHPLPASTLEQKFPFLSRRLPSERLTDLELDAFQVALVPSPRLEDRATARRDGNGGSNRMVLLPLTWKQLMARIRKEVTPAQGEAITRVVTFGDISIDLLAMEVRRSDRVVSLTPMEFKILRFFVSNPNRVISRDDLLDQVWGYENYPCTRTVDNHILKLRRKLEPNFASPVHFLTAHGLGYRFTP